MYESLFCANQPSDIIGYKIVKQIYKVILTWKGNLCRGDTFSTKNSSIIVETLFKYPAIHFFESG